MPLDPGTHQRLHQLVNEHKVVYEVWPAFSLDGDGRRLQVGFDVDLYGTRANGDGSRRLVPGSPSWIEVWENLYDIAGAVLAPVDDQTVYVIYDFRPALSFDPKRHERPDVELVVAIRHRSEYNRAVDRSEEHCLHEVIAALRSIGAQQATWHEAAEVGFDEAKSKRG